MLVLFCTALRFIHYAILCLPRSSPAREKWPEPACGKELPSARENRPTLHRSSLKTASGPAARRVLAVPAAAHLLAPAPPPSRAGGDPERCAKSRRIPQ